MVASAPAARGASPRRLSSAAAPAERAERPPSWLRSKGPWIVLAIVVAGLLVLVASSNLHLFGSSRVATIQASGTERNIPSGYYWAIGFTISTSASVTGSVQATNGVEIYVLNPTNYQSFVRTSFTSGAAWTSGPLSDASFSVSLGPGTWYMVFESPDPAIPTSVLLTSDLIATAT
jgi:hypothetical protein